MYRTGQGRYLYKINSETGELLWKHSISEYTGIENSVSRTTPAITDDSIIIGNQNGGHLIAVDKHTGARKWVTQLDPHVAAIITQSPVVYGDRVFVGVSSSEEGLAVNPNYPCCSFRGSMLVLDKDCGKILWKTFTVPEGYSDGAVWSSTAVIDTKRNLVYVTTGNNYDVPDEVKECIRLKGLESADKCMAEDNYIDAFIVFDMDTGEIKWTRRVQRYDAWTVACIIQVPWCPDPAGPDYDFGVGPNLFSVTIDGKEQDVIGAGQKSGVYWALNPDNGEILWSTLVGPGGTLGGIEWGTAVDGERIYAAVANTNRIPHELISGEVTTGGSWSALDPATGEILWQTADPLENLLTGPLSVANGVVSGAMDPEGHMYALDAETGEILWSCMSGGSVNLALSIVDGTL